MRTLFGRVVLIGGDREEFLGGFVAACRWRRSRFGRQKRWETMSVDGIDRGGHHQG
jgi:hypothetical protein